MKILNFVILSIIICLMIVIPVSAANFNVVKTGPGLPPAGWVPTTNIVNTPKFSSTVHSADTNTNIIDVPVMLWSYGCSPTSASMVMGYYDRHGYPNIYTGNTSNGIFPLTSVWGPATSGDTVFNNENPLSASHEGVDGHITNGSVDDYYTSYGSIFDPYVNGSWTNHTDDSLSDFMGTSQFEKWENIDGSTAFITTNDNSPAVDVTDNILNMRDGTHGMKMFAESKGYTVNADYNQQIYGYNNISNGFTFAQYKKEIDNGYPVMILLFNNDTKAGHTVVGVGYSGTDQIFIHDTWSAGEPNMTWGGTYGGMSQEAVIIFHMAPVPTPPVIIPPVANFTSNVTSGTELLPVQFFDNSTNNATGWIWSYRNVLGTQWVPFSILQNPLYNFSYGVYDISLASNNTAGSNTTIKLNYINASLNTPTPTPTPTPEPIQNVTLAASSGVFRPSNGNWYMDYNNDGVVDKTFHFGTNGDIPVVSDWNVDGVSDAGVFRPANGNWFMDYDADSTVDKTFHFGTSGDSPVTGKFNGFTNNIGVFRNSSGNWYLNYNVNGAVDNTYGFGTSGDIPVTGNWDSGFTNAGVFRPSNGNWYLNESSGLKTLHFGTNGDVPVTGDWNGDGFTDVGVFRPSNGNWYFNTDKSGTVNNMFHFGTTGDIPLVKDIDGDGKIDVMVFRPSNGNWYINYNMNGVVDKTFHFGTSGDIPEVGKWE